MSMSVIEEYKANKNKSLQTLFDAILGVARKMQSPSLNDMGDCVYRGPEGTSCFLGAMIPDSMYNPNMEKQTMGDILRNYPELNAYWKVKNYSFNETRLTELQRIHDSRFPDRELMLGVFAQHNGLQYSPPVVPVVTLPTEAEGKTVVVS